MARDENYDERKECLVIADTLFDMGDGIKPELRNYSTYLTADVNEKGVLDVDTVKGCTAGMSARPSAGCYDGCYAAKIAKFRGFDFSRAITRTVKTKAQAREIERRVAAAPQGFFRIGVMGDPCHAWEETVTTVEWLCEFARPVIITKHWRVASDAQLKRLAVCRAVLNTSVSALDTEVELKHRKREFFRFKLFGGDSVARVVSCDFNIDNPEGLRMKNIQDALFDLVPTLDNPLRASKNHPLALAGVILLTKIKDIASEKTISLANNNTYVGHCAGCPDVCGINTRETNHAPANPRQLKLW